MGAGFRVEVLGFRVWGLGLGAKKVLVRSALAFLTGDLGLCRVEA